MGFKYTFRSLQANQPVRHHETKPLVPRLRRCALRESLLGSLLDTRQDVGTCQAEQGIYSQVVHLNFRPRHDHQMVKTHRDWNEGPGALGRSQAFSFGIKYAHIRTGYLSIGTTCV